METKFIYIVVREGVTTRETEAILDNLYSAVVICEELFDKQEDSYHTYWVYQMENNNYIKKALGLRPDIILLGPNQRISVGKLLEELTKYNASHIKVQRITTLFEDLYLNSSSKIKKKIYDNYNGQNGSL